MTRWCASAPPLRRAFDPAEAEHGQRSTELPGIVMAVLPLAVVMVVNLTMSMLVLPSLDTGFLAEPEWGGTSLAGVGGVWSVIVALSAAIVVLYAFNRGRLKSLRDTRRCRPQRLGAAGDQRRQPGRLRRGGGGAAGLPGGQ